jgi:hypothetical protein
MLYLGEGRRPAPLLGDDCFVLVQFLVPVLILKQLVALFNQLSEPADGFGRRLVVYVGMHFQLGSYVFLEQFVGQYYFNNAPKGGGAASTNRPGSLRLVDGCRPCRYYIEVALRVAALARIRPVRLRIARRVLFGNAVARKQPAFGQRVLPKFLGVGIAVAVNHRPVVKLYVVRDIIVSAVVVGEAPHAIVPDFVMDIVQHDSVMFRLAVF